MRYVTLCSGIDVPTVAWRPLGWEAVAFSEIEPYPSAVLKHHYPEVPNLGDMTRYHEWNLPAFDLLFAGTPCQSFSEMGLRGGIEDDRGNLMLSYIRAADRFDPPWVAWENVPGVLSSRDNAFGHLLGGLSGAGAPVPRPGASGPGRWPHFGVVAGPKRVVAWRVFDSRHFGLPQRRTRVFVLASRGPGNWTSAAALFPLSHSLSGYDAPGGQPPSERAAALRSGSGGRRLVTSTGDLSLCLNAGGMGRNDLETETMVAGFEPGRRPYVRKLTTREAEACQGLPKDYTLIPGPGRMTDHHADHVAWLMSGGRYTAEEADHLARRPDAERYKAIGNGISVPVLSYLGRRIMGVSR